MDVRGHGSVVVEDLEDKRVVDELKPEVVASGSSKAPPPQVTSLSWSSDGQTLYAGYTDNVIRIWLVQIATNMPLAR